MIKKLVKKLFIGRKLLQYFYYKLYEFSLAGMQYGQGKHINSSGELFVLNHVKKRLSTKEKVIVFDVGANVGEYSNACLRIFKDCISLYSFEPSKKALESLKKNLIDKNNAKVFNLGFGGFSTEAYLHYFSEGSKTASIYKRRYLTSGVDDYKEEKINLSTLEEFCHQHEIDQIDLLKLDTEGNELEILKGGEKLLMEERIKFIQFEFGPCNIDSRIFFVDFFQILQAKYDIYRVIKNGLVPISKYSIKNEIFLNINFLAILKTINN